MFCQQCSNPYQAESFLQRSLGMKVSKKSCKYKMMYAFYYKIKAQRGPSIKTKRKQQ